MACPQLSLFGPFLQTLKDSKVITMKTGNTKYTVDSVVSVEQSKGGDRDPKEARVRVERNYSRLLPSREP